MYGVVVCQYDRHERHHTAGREPGAAAVSGRSRLGCRDFLLRHHESGTPTGKKKAKETISFDGRQRQQRGAPPCWAHSSVLWTLLRQKKGTSPRAAPYDDSRFRGCTRALHQRGRIRRCQELPGLFLVERGRDHQQRAASWRAWKGVSGRRRSIALATPTRCEAPARTPHAAGGGRRARPPWRFRGSFRRASAAVAALEGACVGFSSERRRAQPGPADYRW